MGKMLAVLFSIMLTNLSFSYVKSCNNYGFSGNATYTRCVTLPVLNSHLHWNYTNGTVDVAFRHTRSTTNQWVAWALNINGSGMIGAQALVALTSSDGSVQAYTSAVTSINTSLQPSYLSFQVPMIRSERVNESVVIYATLVLPPGETRFNQAWQVGPATNGVPTSHELGSANMNSVGSVDFSNVGRSMTRLKYVHGVLNLVSGGVLLPLGAMIARYLKVFRGADPAWKYIHGVFQASGAIINVAGTVTGLKLGGDELKTERRIEKIITALTAIQVVGSLFKPKSDSNKNKRLCWSVYHSSLGYVVIFWGIINKYKIVDILDSEKKWKHAYTAIFIAFGTIALLFEVLTWFIVLKRKKEDRKMQGPTVQMGPL